LKLNPAPSLRKHRFRSLAVAGVVAVGVVAAIAQTAPAAHADPPPGTTGTLVAVGDETTQDVYNQFATDLGGNALVSYDAFNPGNGAVNGPITYGNCSYDRPDGSTQGLDALEASIGGAVGGGGAPVLPQLGCVDIARSSVGPNAPGSGPAGGNYTGSNPIQFVPFALDAVTGAIGPATGGTPFTAKAYDANGRTLPATTVATQLPSAVNSFSLQKLRDLYGNGIATNVTVNGVTTTFWPLNGSVAQPAGSRRIDLYFPFTEKFWATTLGFNAATPPAWDHTTIVNGLLAPQNDGGIIVNVGEDDGAAVATDPIGYVPFSAAQWISQNNHPAIDRRHGAVLRDINGVAPTVVQNGTTVLNTSFPITRLVYSVVSLARLTNTGDPLHALLDGSSSFLCQDTSTIFNYGFATLKGASTLNATCGEITAPLEAAP
jgi:hypothetical protein